MISARAEEAISWADRALDDARAVGDVLTEARALVERAGAMVDGRSRAEALAALQITLYALARRWGVPLARLEQEVTRRLEREARSGHYLESRFGDLTAIRQHLERRAGSS